MFVAVQSDQEGVGARDGRREGARDGRGGDKGGEGGGKGGEGGGKGGCDVLVEGVHSTKRLESAVDFCDV